MAQPLLPPQRTQKRRTPGTPVLAVPHGGRACIAFAENRWWFAKSPHPPLVFFLEVLILIGFKSLKTELLILRGLRARFPEVFIMRSLVSGTLRSAIGSTGRSACATKLRARGVRFVRKE